MPEYRPSAETNILPPTTEEMLLKYGHLNLDDKKDRAIYSAALGSQDFQPDTPEQAEKRAKAVFQAQLDFKLRWDLHTEQLATQHESSAEVVSIAERRPQLDRFAGEAIMSQAS